MTLTPCRHRPRLPHPTGRGRARGPLAARAFPDAPVYTSFYEAEGTYPEFPDVRIRTAPINKVGPLRPPPVALPFLAPASPGCRSTPTSSSAAAAGPTGRRPAARLVYCHAPARWLYQPASTWADGRRIGQGAALPRCAGAAALGPRAAARADRYLCNSAVVRDRSRRPTGSTPRWCRPAGIDADGPHEADPRSADWADGYLLVVSRLLPYKNVDRVVEALRGSDHRLVVVGAGPEWSHLRAIAGRTCGSSASSPTRQMRWVYAHARALVAPTTKTSA